MKAQRRREKRNFPRLLAFTLKAMPLSLESTVVHQMNSLLGTPEYQPRPRIILPSADLDTAVYMTRPFPDSSCIRVLHSHL